MKRFALLFLAAALTITSCKKENTPDKIDTNFSPGANDVLISEGIFMTEVHTTSGTVKLYKNDTEYTLALEDLSSDNGPDLRVYLSPNKSASSFIDLGKLQAVSGNFEYTFDLSTDVATNNHVLIWCQDASVLFGSAVLQ